MQRLKECDCVSGGPAQCTGWNNSLCDNWSSDSDAMRQAMMSSSESALNGKQLRCVTRTRPISLLRKMKGSVAHVSREGKRRLLYSKLNLWRSLALTSLKTRSLDNIQNTSVLVILSFRH